MTVLPPLLTPLAALATYAYGAAQALLLVYSAHRWTLLFGRRPAPSVPPPPSRWPRVTVQLPVYNEAAVVERLIEQVASLDYPRDRLEIQVLDDSTDETSAIAALAIRRAEDRGVRIRHLRRASREGYKAGALRAGFEVAEGEFFAVFDADFLPPPDFLERLLPHFADPGVGMAQARWTHVNRDASLLTAAQAVLLDAHFVLEHGRRMSRGRFLNFNGSAGVWRRSCIEEAGGWSHATLTEDLDLSYRAQLAGWRFVYDGSVEAPAELPSDVAALKGQQSRWVKGSIQTARRVLPGLLSRPLPWGQKAEAVLHLTSNVAYPLLLVLALLLLPVMLAAEPWPLAGILHGVVLALGVLPVALYLAAAQRALGRPAHRIASDVAAAIALGVGLSLNNARAVLEGLGPSVGVFERTPKCGTRESGDGRGVDAHVAERSARTSRPGAMELALAAYFVAVAAVAIGLGDARAVPFALLLAVGFGFVGAGSSFRTYVPPVRATARCLALALALCGVSPTALAGSLSGPILDEGLTVVLEDVRQMPATSGAPRARINVLREAPDGSGRLFVNDLRGPLYVIRGGSLGTYLDFRTGIANFKTAPGLASGLVSFAFHPSFATNGLFYTVHTEFPGSTPANLVPALPISVNQHSVLTEWHAMNPAADAFVGTRRELIRVAALSPLHNLGVIEFNPNATAEDADYGLLYIASGDFGSVDGGQSAQLQRLDTIYGCILRIDPLGGPFMRNGTTYHYGIPPGNPYAGDGDPATFDEIYTWGHRNAHRLVWDRAGRQSLFACDIGHANLEEIDRLVPGRNFGWPRREGAYALDPAVDPYVVFALPSNDSTLGYTYPAAQYDHEEGRAIAGGVAYRGPVPALWGKFVFGDIVSGRLFYSYLADLEGADDGDPATTAPVYAVHLVHQGQPRTLLQIVQAALGTSTERTDLRFATDLEGALYLTTKEDGFVRKVVSVFPMLAVGGNRPRFDVSIAPNPVRTSAVVTFTTSREGMQSVQVFDVRGRRVRTLLEPVTMPEGAREVRFNVGRGANRLTPGVYFLRVAAAGEVVQRRFVVGD